MNVTKKQNSTLKKCQMILGLFEDMFPRPYVIEPKQQSVKKPKRNESPFKLSNKKLFTNNHMSSKTKSPSNKSFTSIYSKQSRLDRIMRIKPPKHNSTYISQSKSKSKLDTSFNSSISISNKQNRIHNVSRLQRIMNLKVQKPRVGSTLKQYKPNQSLKITPVKKQRSSILELKECKKQIQRQSKQKQKQDRLWATFQRERSIIERQNKRQKQNKYMRERRVEKKVESLVQKTINKIRTQKQLSLRKKKIFNNYLF